MALVIMEGSIILFFHDKARELCRELLFGFHLELLTGLLEYPSEIQIYTSYEIIYISTAECCDYTISKSLIQGRVDAQRRHSEFFTVMFVNSHMQHVSDVT